MDNKDKGSPVANSVLAVNAYPRHSGVTKMRGYLDLQQPRNPLRRCLYTDDSFTAWVEFANDDLLHHIPGGNDPSDPMGAVWIKSDAIVTAGRIGRAYEIAAADYDSSGGGPTPPWRGPTPPWR